MSDLPPDAPAAPAADAAPPAPAPAPSPAAVGPVRPEGLPDDLWEDGKGVKVGDLWSKARDAETQLTELKATVGEKPAAADGYEFALPDGFKAPEGFEVTLDPKDPSLVAAREAAFAAGMTAPAWKAALGVFAQQQVAAKQAVVSQYVAEKAALGANASERMAATDSWLKANLSSAQASALGRVATTKDGVEAIERIIAMRAGPPVAPGGKDAPATKYEGLRGGDMLAAIRRDEAAARQAA